MNGKFPLDTSPRREYRSRRDAVSRFPAFLPRAASTESGGGIVISTICPECKAATFAKQLTAPGFQLKGNGWYATDFKGGAKPAAPAKSDNPPPCQGGNGSCACN